MLVSGFAFQVSVTSSSFAVAWTFVGRLGATPRAICTMAGLLTLPAGSVSVIVNVFMPFASGRLLNANSNSGPTLRGASGVVPLSVVTVALTVAGTLPEPVNETAAALVGILGC